MTRPAKLPVGARRIGICPACRAETLMQKVARLDWACRDCGNVHHGRFRGPVKPSRTINQRHVVELHLAGASMGRIARYYGHSATAVRAAIERSGVAPRPVKNAARGPRPNARTRRVEIAPELLERWPELRVVDIAEIAGVSVATASRRVREHRGVAS